MNKHTGIILCMLLLLLTVTIQLHAQNTIWYERPADATVADTAPGWSNDAEWLKALPVGNGFIGAMVFGDVNKERLQLNEKSLWSGSADDNNNPGASKYVEQIRKLLWEGRYKEATALTNKTQVCKGVGSGSGNGSTAPYGCYQTLGDLWLDFSTTAPYENYYRELNLVNGIATTKYRQQNINYKREVFASYPNRALVVRLTADQPGALSFTLSVNRPERFNTVANAKRLMMSGTLSNGKDGNGMQYKLYAIPLLEGGTLTQKEDKLIVANATAVTIIITAATNYRLHYPDYLNNNFEKELNLTTEKAIATNYALLRSRHIKDFSAYMMRSTLQLSTAATHLPTDKLLEKNAETKNEQSLYPLYYQFGRYVLLSSSRSGSLPANLQGMWANKIQTPWNCDYHTDINVQMNYWPAEITNLSECHLQLTDFIQSLVKPGEVTAKVQYTLNGWCLHPITNVWGYTSPGEEAGWGMHIAATGWICQHLWEHYAFTRDQDYLRKIYPVLKQACLFYFGWLTKNPSTGKLVSGPAASPENSFIAPDGSIGGVSMGPSHDQEVIHNLFNNTLKAAAALKVDDSFIQQLQQTNQQLAMPQIGADGRLMEWAHEFKEVEVNHRHVSHLFALYPGNDISVEKTPALAEAAKKSLEVRGDDGTGWSLAWKINFWARLKEGDHALKLLNRLLQPAYSTGIAMNNAGGTYSNLFCAHPPFQMDGNFGATAGIAEMLLQSSGESITLLPALPSLWKEGMVTGLCARGGFVVDMHWSEGKLVKGSLFSKAGGACTIWYRTKKIKLQTMKGKRYNLDALISN